MKNITPDSPETQVRPAPRFQPPKSLDSKLSDNVAQLSKQLENERDGRMEERFHWILVSMVLFDLAMLPHQPVWLAVLVILLEACILPSLAARLGVDWAVSGLEQFRRIVEERFKKADKPD